MTVPQLTTFRIDVTPPAGHPLCAGWAPPALGVADPLSASGVILAGCEAPVVLLSIDWAEISNRTYRAWLHELAAATGTDTSRVAVHCIHSHSSPWPDAEAQRMVERYPAIRPIMDPAFCDDVIQRIAGAARAAMGTLRPVTHVTTGRGRVHEVASNRRIIGEDGLSQAVRWTTTRDAAVRAEPEGEIDPWLKSIGFWNEDEKLAVLHYYAVHPSSYEDSWISPDFVGLARDRRMSEDNGVPHLYFTECAGDITAGKYNDGNRALREIFTDRVHSAMVEAEDNAQRNVLLSWRWAALPVRFPPRQDQSRAYLEDVLADEGQPSVPRGRAALALAYHERYRVPIDIGALHLNEDVCVLHLPGESFIEFQHFAQAERPDAFVAVPSYGDCGPGYICLEKSFAEGGYEPTDSFVAPGSEFILKDAIARVLEPASLVAASESSAIAL